MAQFKMFAYGYLYITIFYRTSQVRIEWRTQTECTRAFPLFEVLSGVCDVGDPLVFTHS